MAAKKLLYTMNKSQYKRNYNIHQAEFKIGNSNEN
jgi:hypothetical protein